MKLEATFVIENSIREDQIEFIMANCKDRYAKESTLAEKTREDIERLFSELSGQKDYNGVPAKVIVKDVKVFFDDDKPYSEDNTSGAVKMKEEPHEDNV